MSAKAGSIEGYYRFHSLIYDSTRWSFLFGRSAILGDIAAGGAPTRILEVGCGTGRNIVNLCTLFPQAGVTGVDLSAAMLGVAREKVARFGDRVRLVERAYDAPLESGGFDLVLFSYALTMFNPGYAEAIAAAWGDLATGGRIAVVDFHDTPHPLFARWMWVNHVRMQGQLLAPLHDRFTPLVERLCPAYGGWWRYLMFVGRKRAI